MLFFGLRLKVERVSMCLQTDLHISGRKGGCQAAFRVCDGTKSVCESQEQQLGSAVENVAGASRETQIHHCSGMRR